ncbi:unnamed protein product [Darwinula stevensoni]|uniref:Uncharacterized protein n=1 Tax=Darwinula stevensoni TaxID=69355 RepID=A0A7R9FPM0_9CRUS|nr:unnamed protein product [Darwinula stevensoni]CAG0898191.1 unnamed protein product [Darwinula stevensoni]
MWAVLMEMKMLMYGQLSPREIPRKIVDSVSSFAYISQTSGLESFVEKEGVWVDLDHKDEVIKSWQKWEKKDHEGSALNLTSSIETDTLDLRCMIPLRVRLPGVSQGDRDDDAEDDDDGKDISLRVAGGLLARERKGVRRLCEVVRRGGTGTGSRGFRSLCTRWLLLHAQLRELLADSSASSLPTSSSSSPRSRRRKKRGRKKRKRKKILVEKEEDLLWTSDYHSGCGDRDSSGGSSGGSWSLRASPCSPTSACTCAKGFPFTPIAPWCSPHPPWCLASHSLGGDSDRGEMMELQRMGWSGVPKSSSSLTSLSGSNQASPSSTPNSLTRSHRKTLNKERWRRSWGLEDSLNGSLNGSFLDSENKDDFWAAIQDNYQFLMDSQLMDSCKEAAVDLSWTQWNLSGDMANQDLCPLEGKENIIPRENENGARRQLDFHVNPNHIPWEASITKGWEALLQGDSPESSSSPDKSPRDDDDPRPPSPSNEVEGGMRRLRAWLKEVEERLQKEIQLSVPLSIVSNKILEEKIRACQVFGLLGLACMVALAQGVWDNGEQPGEYLDEGMRSQPLEAQEDLVPAESAAPGKGFRRRFGYGGGYFWPNYGWRRGWGRRRGWGGFRRRYDDDDDPLMHYGFR